MVGWMSISVCVGDRLICGLSNSSCRAEGMEVLSGNPPTVFVGDTAEAASIDVEGTLDCICQMVWFGVIGLKLSRFCYRGGAGQARGGGAHLKSRARARKGDREA